MTPPEANESSGTNDQTFKAGDLLKLIGLTYRQLNDWENRAKIFDQQRAKTEGWRKFTGEEALALAVCASLRRQLSLPLEKVGWLYRWLMDASGDPEEVRRAEMGRVLATHIERDYPDLFRRTGEKSKTGTIDDATRFFRDEYANAKLDSYRACPIRYAYFSAKFACEPVYLYTDFETRMILFEQNLVSAIAMRFKTNPVVICPLNSVFDEFLKATGKPLLGDDKKPSSTFDEWKERESRVQITADEQEILRLLRSKQYQRVTVHLKDGRLLRADIEEELPKVEAAKLNGQILDSIQEGRFTTVSVQKGDGAILRLLRKSTVKFSAR